MRSIKFPLIPAKAGTQAESVDRPTGLPHARSRLGPRLRGDERFGGAIGIALALSATPALAHEGHHEHMSVAQAAHHLLTQPDHQIAFAGLVVTIVAGGWAWIRATARK